MKMQDLLTRLVVAVETIALTKPVPRICTGPFETREELCENVRALHKQGYTGLFIGKKYGISPTTVSRILHGDKKQDNG